MLPIIEECRSDQTYWDCYWERFAYFYGLDFDQKPQGDKFWEWAGWTHALMANYLLYSTNLPETIPNTRRGIRALCDEELNSWSDIIVYTRWSETPELIKYNENLDKATSAFNVSWLTIQNYVKFPSALLMGGFSNMKEFYAWAAFIMAWSYRITNDNFYYYKAEDFLDLSLGSPSDADRPLWKTPATEDNTRLSQFSEDIFDAATKVYMIDIKPYLINRDLREVKLFAENDMKEDMLLFSVSLAMKTKADKRDETLDIAKYLLIGGATYFVVKSLLK